MLTWHALMNMYADAGTEEHQHMCCLMEIALPQQTYLLVMCAAEVGRGALAAADIVWQARLGCAPQLCGLGRLKASLHIKRAQAPPLW